MADAFQQAFGQSPPSASENQSKEQLQQYRQYRGEVERLLHAKTAQLEHTCTEVSSAGAIVRTSSVFCVFLHL